MNRLRIEHASSVPESNWRPFPGGELEGLPSKALCPKCRESARHGTADRPRAQAALCFQCYSLDLERNRALRAAGELNTASEARFQSSLPFEPVNHARLTRLKAELQEARLTQRKGAGVYVEKRRRAQIEARHALATIVQGLKQRRLASISDQAEARSASTSPTFTGELQLPVSWLPFVVGQ